MYTKFKILKIIVNRLSFRFYLYLIFTIISIPLSNHIPDLISGSFGSRDMCRDLGSTINRLRYPSASSVVDDVGVDSRRRDISANPQPISPLLPTPLVKGGGKEILDRPFSFNLKLKLTIYNNLFILY